MRKPFIRPVLPAHIVATGVALFYAWKMSKTAYLTTGLQFITPLIIIMVIHLMWLALARNLKTGFSQTVYRRSAQSAVELAFTIFLASIVAPAYATSETGQNILMVLFCAAIIALMMGVLAAISFILASIIKRTFRANRPNSNDPDSRLFHVGSLAVAGVALVIFNFERLPNTYGFTQANQSTASSHIDPSPAQVWQMMEQAT